MLSFDSLISKLCAAYCILKTIRDTSIAPFASSILLAWTYEQNEHLRRDQCSNVFHRTIHTLKLSTNNRHRSQASKNRPYQVSRSPAQPTSAKPFFSIATTSLRKRPPSTISVTITRVLYQNIRHSIILSVTRLPKKAISSLALQMSSSTNNFLLTLDSSTRPTKMGAVHLTIEPCPTASAMITPKATQTPTPTNEYKEGGQGEPPFSHLLNGICNFFTGIFKPKEDRSWKEIAEQREEKIKVLEARLAEKAENEKRMEARMEGQVERGTKSVRDVLSEHAEAAHATRMGEIRGLAVLLQQHEDLVVRHQRYVKAYEDLARKQEQVEEQNRFLMRQNEELARLKIELENRLATESGKVAMYERSWYGAGGGGSSVGAVAQNIWN